ncbi:MAG TPA: glycosyltransferase family 2 protein [Puia sp.]|nr:glycosyltransferase family 2 protein [Puia sp.]
MESDILFSIVIPVKNGDLWLDKLLTRLVQQTLFARSEIIVIDSGSMDRSLEIISRYPVRLIRIPPAEFNHGLTRNLGAREARGEYVVMTVQDAMPESERWLERLLDGFTDERVVAVCGQQVVPHERDKNPVLWFRPVSGHRTWYCHYDDPGEFLKLSPAEQREMAGWDNVTAAYRRSVLLEYPFPATDFAEDISWARMMLLKGFTLGHVSGAIAYHYHHQLPEFILPRYFSVFYYEFKLFRLKPALQHSVLRNVLVAARILLKESGLSWMEKGKWLLFNVRYWLALRGTIRKFNQAADKSEADLDLLYQHICNKPPQALKY